MKKPYLFVGVLLAIWLIGVGIYVYAVLHIKAPEIIIQGVAHGATYPRGTVLRPQVIVRSPLDPAPRYTVLLNGAPYNGSPIQQPDLYTLKVQAHDSWGHRSMKIVSFVIDVNPAEKPFDFVPVSVRFSRTPNGNTKVRFFLYIKKVKSDFKENICGGGVTLYYEDYGWGLIPARHWRVLSRAEGTHTGWLAEYVSIFATDATEHLRQAIQRNDQNLQFDGIICYSPSDDCDEKQVSDYWLDKTPLRLDAEYAKSFRRRHRFVLYRGHPTIDPISDAPNLPMNFRQPSQR
jgi:hypothetical protein